MEQKSNINIHIGSLLNLDYKYFLKGSVFSFVQQTIGIICGLILSYFIGHYVSKQIFGEYNLVLSYIGLLTFFSLPGIDTALVQSVSKGFDKSLIFGFWMKLKFSIISSFILILLAIYNLLTKNTVLGYNLLIGAVTFPFIYTFTIYSSFLTAKKRFDLLAILNSISSIFYVFIFIIFILFTPTSTKLFIAYVIGSFFPAIISFLYSIKLVRKQKIDKQLIPYGLFLTSLTTLPWITGNLGNIILGHLLGVEFLAIFAVASGFLVSTQKIFVVFYKPITAKLAEQSIKNHFATIKKHSIKLIVIGIGMYIFIWFAIPILIKFLYNQDYYSAIDYSRLICLAIIPLPITWVLSDITIYQKRKKLQIFLSIIPQVLKILLYFILIPIWKINGLIIIILAERYLTPIFNLFLLHFNQISKNR